MTCVKINQDLSYSHYTQLDPQVCIYTFSSYFFYKKDNICMLYVPKLQFMGNKYSYKKYIVTLFIQKCFKRLKSIICCKKI